MTKLVNPRSPALPLAEPVYTRDFKNRYSNILRLYFNQLDTLFQALLGTDGNQYLQSPHIAAQNNTNQYALGDNIPTLLIFDSLDSISGFTLNPAGYAKANQDGVYKVDYSLQLANTDNIIHDVFVWLQTNGTVVPGSSSRFTLQARKSAGVYSYVTAYSSVTFEIQKDDEIRLWWATEKAATSGGTLGVLMEAFPAQTLPYVRPANPSAIGSIVYVSRLP